jgi:protocatechuate 3,4-dioxygenase beta subunit
MTGTRGPTYQGRELPRPDDELVDQGLGFDLGTLLERRRALQVLGLGLAGAGLAACGAGGPATSSSSSSGSSTASTSAGATASATSTAGGDLVEIPDETAGPFPGDGSNGPDVLARSGVVRRDIRSSFGTGSATAKGVGLTLELTVLDVAGGGDPMTGAAVYAWHCDAGGSYSMYASGLEDENYLRGVQVTDSSGVVSFTTVVPGCYSGRWPHIHFEVYPDEASITDASAAIATSQVALPRAMCDAAYATDGYSSSVANFSSMSLASDNVFGDDSGVHQLATVTGSTSGGFTARLTAPVDTRTAPTGGGMR